MLNQTIIFNLWDSSRDKTN